MLENIAVVVFLFTIPLFIGCVIALIINAVKKKPKKTVVIVLLCDLVLFFAATAYIGINSDYPTDTKVAEGTEQKEEVEVKEEKKSDTKSDEKKEESKKEEKEPSKEDDDSYFAKSSKKLDALEEIDTGITDVLVEKGYKIDHATAIQEILNTIGVESIEIQSMTGDPEKGLNSVVSFPNGYTDDDRRFYFTTEDGVLFYAGFLSEDLYDSEKGGYLKNYNDVHVPEKEVSWDEFYKLQELAEPAVKECLNYPNTANFDGFSYRVGRSDDNYQLLGNVTAKNGLGVKDTISFSVWFVKKNDTFTIEGIALDGIRVK